MSKNKGSLRKLSVFAVAMITISSVDSIRNLPGSAQLGSQVIFYFILAGICYFIPIALVCAELSSTYPENGGIYLWGKKTIGRHFGFLALWYQFAENLVYYPPLLVFIIATLLYPFSESASNNPYIMFTLINLIFWGITIINLFGLKASAVFTEIFGMFGTIFPMLLICGIGIYSYFFLPEKNLLDFSFKSIIPNFHHLNIGMTFTAVVLSLTGMEIATVYAKEVENPQKSYPKALIIATVFILTTLTIGSLSIANIIGAGHSSLSQGVIDFFSHFLHSVNLAWLTPVIALAIFSGGIASLNNWIIAPVKGLNVAAQDGFMPHILKKENKHSAPVSLLLVQGLIVTGLSSIFLFVPSVNEDMWFLNILMTILYMIMYMSIFISFIASRIIDKDIHRPFKVPGGIIGMWFVFIVGMMSTVITILLSFKPDYSAYTGITNGYIFGIALVTGVIIFTIPALVGIIYQIKNSGTREE